MTGWEDSESTCPKCGKITEYQVEICVDEFTGQEDEFIIAERCKPCGWTVNFEEDDT